MIPDVGQASAELMDLFRRPSTSVETDGQDMLLQLVLKNSVAVVGGITSAVVAAIGGVDGWEMALALF